MAMMKKVIYWLFPVVLILAFITIFLLKHNSEKVAEIPPKNYYSISDESVGLSFNMSKGFVAISKQDLASLNPHYLYGFNANNNPGVACYVSQTAITKQGKITAAYLKDGTFREIKKSLPNARLDDWNLVKFKKANGIFLQISYSDNNQKIIRPEIVSVTSKSTTFAYCQSPEEAEPLYREDFTTFFSSLEVQN